MPEPYSLAGRAWLRVARATGQHEVVRLCEIADPSISHLDTGRPDCDAAISEFLIGLLAVALGPADDEEWLELYSSPPDATALTDALTPFAEALIVDGEGQRSFKIRTVSRTVPRSPLRRYSLTRPQTTSWSMPAIRRCHGPERPSRF